MGELFGVAIETNKGQRERVWPDGESELVDEGTAWERFEDVVELCEAKKDIEGRPHRTVIGVYLVKVTFNRIYEARREDVTRRMRHWNWGDRPLGTGLAA